MESVFVGIEIGGTKIQVVTGDDQAQVVTRNRFNADLAKGAEGIREQIAAALVDIANRHAGGRLVSVLEGGYNIAGLASASAAHCRRLVHASDKTAR